MLCRPQILLDGEWQSIYRTMSDHSDSRLIADWKQWVAECPTSRRLYSA